MNLVTRTLLFCFLFTSIHQAHAFKRYFRGDTNPANTRWGNPACWTRTSAGVYGSDVAFFTSTYPGGTNNINGMGAPDLDSVIIDGSSFAAGVTTLILDQTINICGTLIFEPTVVTGANISNGALEIHGSLFMQPNLGLPIGVGEFLLPAKRMLSLGGVNFKPEASTFPATTYSIITNNIAFNNGYIQFTSEANYDIIGNLCNSTGGIYAGGVGINEYSWQFHCNGIIIDIGNGRIQNTSADTIRCATLSISSGKLISNGHIISRYAVCGNQISLAQSSLAYPASIPYLDLNGTSDFLGQTFTIGLNSVVTLNSPANKIHRWGAVAAVNNSKLILKNATIQFPYSTTFYAYAGGDLISGNSVVWMRTKLSSSILYLNGDTLNEAHVLGYGRLDTYLSAFKKLVIEDSAQLYNASINSRSNIVDNGTFEMKPGSSLKTAGGYYPSTGAVGAGYPQISMGANTQFIADGTCTKKIEIDMGEIAMNATTSYTMNHLQVTTNRIWGAGSPYNAGTGSNVLGQSYGWVATANIGTTYYWQYPLSTPTLVVTDTATYGNWHDVSNWSSVIGASPATPMAAAVCLPSRLDSVVFPNGSYVNIRSLYTSCKSMTWLGTGVLAGVSDTSVLKEIPVKDLDIYGSLTFSSAMTNKFYGDVNFRAWQSYPTITSANKQFNRKVNFIGTLSSTGQVLSKWTLQDSITATRELQPWLVPYGYGGDRTIIASLQSGDLNTNGYNMRFNSFYVTYVWAKDSTTLNLNNSKVSIIGDPYISNNNKYPMFIHYSFSVGGRVKINAGTSHIIFKTRNGTFSGGYGQTRLFMQGGDHTLYDVSFMDDDLNGSTYQYYYTGTNSFHNMDFYYRGTIYHYPYNSTINNIHRLRTNINNPNTSTPFLITPNDATQINCKNVIDTAIYYGNADLKVPVDYNYLMQVSPGKIYNIASTPLNAIQRFPLATSRLSATGTCVNPITIIGGQFSSSINNQSATYLLVNSNTVTTNNFNYTSSVLSGTSGWNGTPDAGRTLHWKDITAGNSTGSWSNPNMWEVLNNAGTVIAATPNCPPTPLDTVVFDNASFTGTADTVDASLGSAVANCHTMKWKNTSNNHIFKGTTSDNIHIYGSLYFGKFMSNKYMGDVTFRGSSPLDSVRSNGRPFNRQVIFNADAPTIKHWHLADSIYANYWMGSWFNTLFNGQLIAGSLHTHGKRCTFGTFISYSTSYRKLDLDTSTIILTLNCSYPFGPHIYYRSNAFVILDNNIIVKADKSTIHLKRGTQGQDEGATGFMGGGHKYNKIISDNTGGFYYWGDYSGVNKDTIYHMNLRNTGGSILLRGAFIHKLNQVAGSSITLGYGFTGLSTVSKIDSFISKSNVVISDSNHFVNQFYFEPGKSYTFPANKVNYFGNRCETKVTGTPGNNVFIYSSTSGQKAYWRKDSGVVCSNYSVLQDNYAVGNGKNYASPSNIEADVLIDTVLNSSLYDGATLLPTGAINPPLSGRAKYIAGSFAINNNNTTKGWDFSPYSSVPSATLTLSKDTICFRDSSLATITLGAAVADVFPIIVVYHNEFGTRKEKTFITSANSPFSWYAKPTSGSILVRLDTVIINQCFNNTLQLNESKRLTVATPPAHGCPIVLPIELLAFEAEKNETKTKLFWTTATEINNNYFNVEKSLDGLSFEVIASIPGAGNSTEILNYNCFDEHPNKGINYYRLKQVDFDGTVSYSDLKAIVYEEKATSLSLIVKPNPAQSSSSLVLILDNLILGSDVNISAINALGQEVYQTIYYNNYESTHIEHIIELGDIFRNGIYLIRVKTTYGIITQKVIVQ